MSVRQLRDWAAFYRLEPFSANSIETAIAIQTAALSQPHARKGVKLNAADFLPFKIQSKKINMADLV